MAEEHGAAPTRPFVTADGLRAQLRSLGIESGDTVLVHSSLKSLGWVNGGAVAVVQALLAAVGDAGTLVMPAQSNDWTDPEHWKAPPVPREWQKTIRDTMPAFDPRLTPTQAMGSVAELFRTWPGTVRSAHPSSSFAALGPLAAQITRDHPLSDPLGADSPLGKLHDLAARILLIGVDFDTCTALHFAESIVWPDRRRILEGAPLMIDGARRWVRFEVPQLMDSEAFLAVGASALRAGIAVTGPLGSARGVLVGMRALVDHAVGFWSSERNSPSV